MPSRVTTADSVTTASLADRVPPAASSATSSSSPLENGASSARGIITRASTTNGFSLVPCVARKFRMPASESARSIVANRIMPRISIRHIVVASEAPTPA